jgi:hypothetical protein
LFGAEPAGHAAEVRNVPRDLSGDTQADAAAAHFGKTDGVPGSAGVVAHLEFPAANLFVGPTQVAIELHRIHRQVEVGVKQQRCLAHERRWYRPVTALLSRAKSKLLLALACRVLLVTIRPWTEIVTVHNPQSASAFDNLKAPRYLGSYLPNL